MNQSSIARSVPFINQNLAVIGMNSKCDQLFMPNCSVNWASINVIGFDRAYSMSVDAPGRERVAVANHSRIVDGTVFYDKDCAYPC